MKIKRLLTLILVILAIACLSLGVVGCKNKDKDVEVEKYVDIPLDAKVELFDPFFFGTAAMMIGDEIIEPDVEVTIGDETVITDGGRILVNSSGSSALAKAGSGDVLSGLIASVSAYVSNPLFAAGISAYLHGAAGDRLAEELTEYGVTPSDLSRQVCKILAETINNG